MTSPPAVRPRRRSPRAAIPARPYGKESVRLIGDCREPMWRPVTLKSYIGDVRHRDASSPVAVLRSKSATRRPSWPYG